MATVTVSHGQLAGSQLNGVHSFKGIPYAAPISGDNRWLAPKPPEPWSSVRDATRFGDICPQEKPPNKWLAGRAGKVFIETLWQTETQSDDCLNLNVWTPTLETDASLPVMFWIHGGAFTTGSGSLRIYDGTNLAARGVVVVSINYRLGMMGSFVAPGMFDDDFCTPNRGFLDQVAALEWVQENIASFGGDPNNVTIFGESAGGQSVAVLLASPATTGLFRRAIAQSGTPTFGSSIDDHEHFAVDLLEAMDVEPGSRAALSALSGPDTARAQRLAQKLLPKGGEERYGGLVDHGSIGCIYGDDFMPASILDSLASGVGSDVDLMIGSVLEDGRLFPLVMPGPEAFSSWLCIKLFKNAMNLNGDVDEVFGRYRALMPDAAKKTVRGHMLTDWMFRRGTVEAAERHLGTTYLYQFDWSSPVLRGGIGAMHGIDVPFANGNLNAFAPLLGDLEAVRDLAEGVQDAWVSFATNGTPASSKLPDWPTFDAEGRAAMVFDTTSQVRQDHDRSFSNAWHG